MRKLILFAFVFGLSGCASFSPDRFGGSSDEVLRRDAKICEFETKKTGMGGIRGQDVFDTCMESKGHSPN